MAGWLAAAHANGWLAADAVVVVERGRGSAFPWPPPLVAMRERRYGDTVLRVCVQEIRAALGDTADAPQYLATVGRQGYQWLVGDVPEVAPPLLPGPYKGRFLKSR